LENFSILEPPFKHLEDSLRTQLQKYGGGFGGLTLLRPPTPGVSDNPFKFCVHDSFGRVVGIAAYSQREAPRAAAIAAEKAKVAKSSLGVVLGSVILDPIALGEVEGLSYVVLPRKYPLSNSPLLWRLQRRSLRPRLLSWLRSVTRETISTPSEAEVCRDFLDPLKDVADDGSFEGSVRSEARLAVDRLLKGKWAPKHVLSHNDLWKDNILLDSGAPWVKLAGKFAIIDWGGSHIKGHAIYDLIRLSSSVCLSRRGLTHELQEHSLILGCSVSDTKCYLLASLGFLGRHLECFPRERYCAIVHSCAKTLFSCHGVSYD